MPKQLILVEVKKSILNVLMCDKDHNFLAQNPITGVLYSNNKSAVISAIYEDIASGDPMSQTAALSVAAIVLKNPIIEI